MDAACERMSKVTQSFKPASSLSILPVERVSKAVKSFAEASVDLHRSGSGVLLILGGDLFEGHG